MLGYVTEKYFRALAVGSVPVVLGGGNISDFLPSSHAAIHVRDYATPAALAQHLRSVGDNQSLYEQHLAWKHQRGVQNERFRWRFLDPTPAARDGVANYLSVLSGWPALCARLHMTAPSADGAADAPVIGSTLTPLDYTCLPAGNQAVPR